MGFLDFLKKDDSQPMNYEPSRVNDHDTLQEDYLNDYFEPLEWSEYDGSAQITMPAEAIPQEWFETRAEEGFCGNGYDIESLSYVYIEDNPEFEGVIEFDPEAGMYCAFSDDAEALKKFALGFSAALRDKSLFDKLLARAEVI